MRQCQSQGPLFKRRGAGSLTSDAIEYLQGKQDLEWVVLPCSPSSLLLPTSPWASWHAQGLGIEETCLEVFPPLPSPIFAAPGSDASTRQSTKSLVHPHFPRCYPKRFKLDPVPLHAVGMAVKVGELFLSGGRRGRGRKGGFPSRTSFSGGSHGGKVGWKKERSIKKKHFREGGGNFFIFFQGLCNLLLSGKLWKCHFNYPLHIKGSPPAPGSTIYVHVFQSGRLSTAGCTY